MSINEQDHSRDSSAAEAVHPAAPGEVGLMPERVATVVPEDGLHARPGATFVEIAADSDADVTVAHTDGDPVNAASMLAVTGLGIEQGDEVRVIAEGEGAETTLDKLERVLTTPEAEL